MKHLSESELISLMRTGDESAFTEFVRRYSPAVAKTVKAMLGDVPEADEVGQETFIRFWTKIHRFRQESAASTYLTRIAINLSLNELQKRKSRFGFLNRYKNDQSHDHSNRNPAHDENFGRKQLIEMALAALEPAHRSVVVLRLVQGYTTAETAEMLKIPQGTVLSRLSRAQEKMRQIMGPQL